MRLRERALKRNLQHMKRKEEEVVKKERKLVQKQAEIDLKEKELEDRQRVAEELERQVAAFEHQIKRSSEEGSNSVGASFTVPPFIDGALDDTDHFLNDRSELVVRRINSQNQSNQLNRTKTDNTSNSFKNSDTLNSKTFNNKVGTSMSSGLTLNRTLVNSFHISPRSSRDVFQSGNIVGTSGTHDYTDIMGYKNIEISRDVDQSYMLKGTNHHSSLNKTDAS